MEPEIPGLMDKSSKERLLINSISVGIEPISPFETSRISDIRNNNPHLVQNYTEQRNVRQVCMMPKCAQYPGPLLLRTRYQTNCRHRCPKANLFSVPTHHHALIDKGRQQRIIGQGMQSATSEGRRFQREASYN